MIKKWQVYMGCAALLFGVAFSQILPSQLQAVADPNPQSRTLVETIKQLEEDISVMENNLEIGRAHV